MRNILVSSLAALPLLAGCSGMSVGVGVGGSSGNVGVGGSATVPNCGPAMKDGKMQAGLAAGGHYDPHATGKHEGPKGDGHRGDLPVLNVDAKGNATEMMHAFRLSVEAVRGRAFVIHEGGDNYSDQPKPLGGGGARIACGVVS
jgi:Cu-Zn family superoxide dismutase